ncbi:methenyltetrahydrofolate synthase domain-containing protein isoform X1 [Kryptolebias marmoratus]|uniref:Methenyltetrahydrofolate synthase domain-containing protein n=1 Tax=Kryptolebias marmoratus TaxID=37003 RepID=A0A3Q3ABC1_KRYMA|nr:methenyltetrahydrofolate synthase domain-containing protein isoform X1 [Kryptolebias marmoratus]
MEFVIKINSGASKWDIRQKVWDYIEEKNLANFPRPVHNRIPNFKGAFGACSKVTELQVFTETAEVKVDPDKPLEGARLAVLQAQKTLLVPTPRLRTGLFNKITPPQGANKEQLRICSSSQGVKDFSVPVDLDAKVKVDLVVVGSVAVSEKGCRIGKGEGFADLEWAMMASMGAVSESTVVVTVVHDCQVVDIPDELMGSHDLTVDYILTPSRVIKTNCELPKPHGIIWNKLDTEKLKKIPILKKLRALEEQAGKDVTLGATPPAAEPTLQDDQPKRQPRRRPRRNTQQDTEGETSQESKPEKETETGQKARQQPARKESRGSGRRAAREQGSEEGGGEEVTRRKLPQTVTTVYLGGIPTGLRVSELKAALRERKAAPLRLTWQGAQHRAFLDYTDPQVADQALEALQGLCLNGQSLQAELAKSQRGQRRSGQRQRPSAGQKPKMPQSEITKETEN